MDVSHCFPVVSHLQKRFNKKEIYHVTNQNSQLQKLTSSLSPAAFAAIASLWAAFSTSNVSNRWFFAALKTNAKKKNVKKPIQGKPPRSSPNGANTFFPNHEHKKVVLWPSVSVGKSSTFSLVFQRSPKDVQLHKVKPNHDAPRWIRSHRVFETRVGNLWGTARGAVLLAPPWAGLKPPALSWDYASVFTNAPRWNLQLENVLWKKKSPNFPHWVWIKNHRIFHKDWASLLGRIQLSLVTGLHFNWMNSSVQLSKIQVHPLCF